MIPKLLSSEELERALTVRSTERLRAHIAALEADNAALLACLRTWLDAEADAECPDLEDMTAKQAAAFGCFMEAHDVAGRTHPGATLLAEHAKALVRARNEGLEKAVSELMRAGYSETGDMIPRIHALKETEQ